MLCSATIVHPAQRLMMQKNNNTLLNIIGLVIYIYILFISLKPFIEYVTFCIIMLILCRYNPKRDFFSSNHLNYMVYTLHRIRSSIIVTRNRFRSSTTNCSLLRVDDTVTINIYIYIRTHTRHYLHHQLPLFFCTQKTKTRTIYVIDSIAKRLVISDFVCLYKISNHNMIDPSLCAQNICCIDTVVCARVRDRITIQYKNTQTRVTNYING